MKMFDVKQYFLGDNADILLGIDRPKEEQTFYYDDDPLIKLRSMSNYVMLGFVVKDGDEYVNHRILLTAKQARGLAKHLSKHLKKLAKRI